jgi:hypothetical protein
MAQDDGAARQRASSRAVRGTVINNNYVWITLADVPNDPSDHAGLVEGSNHHDDDLGGNDAFLSLGSPVPSAGIPRRNNT